MVEHRAEPQVAVLHGARGAWFATAVGVPVHAVLAVVLGGLASLLFSDIADAPEDGELVAVTLVVLAGIHLLILLGGIVAFAHTVGRFIDSVSDTRGWSAGRSAVALGATAGALGLVAVPLFVVHADYPGAGMMLVLLGIMAPCAGTAAFTRLLLPHVASGTWVRSAVAFLAAAMLVLAVVASLWLVGILG